MYATNNKLKLVELTLRFARYVRYKCVSSVGLIGNYIGGVRARHDAVHALRRARQQLSGFLLRRGGAITGGPLGPSCIAAGSRVSSSDLV
jgi:hypothetical protein